MSWIPKLHSMCLCNLSFVCSFFFFRRMNFFFSSAVVQQVFFRFLFFRLFNLFCLWSVVFVVAFTLVKMSNRPINLFASYFIRACIRVLSAAIFMLLLFADGTCAFRKFTLPRVNSHLYVRLNHLRIFFYTRPEANDNYYFYSLYSNFKCINFHFS